MKMIAFYNNKGGVGKTTSVINVAYALAKQYKVVVVDCDGQCNTSRFFADGFNPNADGVEMSFVKSFVSPVAALNATRYGENLKLISASSKLNDIIFEYEKLDKDKRKDNISKLKTDWLEPWQRYKPDYIIVDLPPAMNILTEEILTVCDYVFVPIELGTFAVQGIKRVTEKITSAGTKFGGVFASKFDKRNSADEELYKIIKKNLGDKVLETRIPYSNAIKNSISFNLTVAEYMSWITPSRCYDKLAQEIIKICNED